MNEPLITDLDPAVCALFVDAAGIYPRLLGTWRCWAGAAGVPQDDARNYAGPYPVVAHPPCHLWTNLAAVNYKRYGGEHNRPGNDGGRFAAALAAVRRWGGVLEHPALSKAWSEHGVGPRHFSGPGWRRYDRQTWCCLVFQSAYGHKAEKKTRLLYCGARPPFELNWAREPGTHQCGWFDRKKPTLGKREASATPEAFARELIRLAAWSRGA